MGCQTSGSCNCYGNYRFDKYSVNKVSKIMYVGQNKGSIYQYCKVFQNFCIVSTIQQIKYIQYVLIIEELKLSSNVCQLLGCWFSYVQLI
jgi:hypothetical protein